MSSWNTKTNKNNKSVDGWNSIDEPKKDWPVWVVVIRLGLLLFSQLGFFRKIRVYYRVTEGGTLDIRFEFNN